MSISHVTSTLDQWGAALEAQRIDQLTALSKTLRALFRQTIEKESVEMAHVLCAALRTESDEIRRLAVSVLIDLPVDRIPKPLHKIETVVLSASGERLFFDLWQQEPSRD